MKNYSKNDPYIVPEKKSEIEKYFSENTYVVQSDKSILKEIIVHHPELPPAKTTEERIPQRRGVYSQASIWESQKAKELAMNYETMQNHFNRWKRVVDFIYSQTNRLTNLYST